MPLTLESLPFARKDALELLGFDLDRIEVDEDFSGYGWGVAESLALSCGRQVVRVLERPLVVALHTPDDAQPGALQLEFWVDDGGEEVAVAVSWERFSAAKVRPLLTQCDGPLVLALCNPHATTIRRPAWLDDRPFFYADGDVTAWFDLHAEHPLRLDASQWHQT